MSVTSDVKPVLTLDARIADIKSQLEASALVGSRDNSFYSYSATTASANSVNVNCSLPSENVVFDRLIFIGAKVNFELTMNSATPAGPPTGTRLFRYGNDCAFQQFPLNGMISNNNVKVNSVSFNMSQDDLQGVLLKTQDLNDLARSNMCMSPSYPDQYLEFSDAQKSRSNNPLAGYNLDSFSSLVSRGSHPIEDVSYFLSENAATLASVDEDAFVAVDKSTKSGNYKVKFSATFFEPLLLSPFIFSSRKISKAGLTNVQNLTFNFTIDNALRNVWSQLPISGITDGSAGANYKLSLSSTPFNDFTVYINCLTPHITQVLPPISILPCYTYERYISSQSNTQEIATNATKDIVLNNLVLSQIPELMYIVVRKPMSSTSPLDAKSFLTINSCAINFMNAQGMLSNCDKHLLFKISKENGYADNWYQWSGKAYGGVYVSDTDYTLVDLKTTGSVLIINPAKDLSISNVYLTNGSRGNYNFQIKLNVTNYYSDTVTPEVMVVCKNACYLKNFVGGRSTLTAGYFDMSMLQSVVTQPQGELTNADLVQAQQGGISDQSLGEIEPASKFEGGSMRRGSGRVGGSVHGKSNLKSKICL